MPTFELVSVEEATIKTTTSKRAEIINEYLGYLDQLTEGQAGKLHLSEGETAIAVRRRLGAAAKLAGKELVIKRAGDEVYFWVGEKPRRRHGRRGRPQKAAGSEA